MTFEEVTITLDKAISAINLCCYIPPAPHYVVLIPGPVLQALFCKPTHPLIPVFFQFGDTVYDVSDIYGIERTFCGLHCGDSLVIEVGGDTPPFTYDIDYSPKD